MSDATYEIVLGPTARAVISRLGTSSVKDALAEALRTELSLRLNPRITRRYDDKEVEHVALSMGYMAVVGKLTNRELERLARERGHVAFRSGWYVFDLLSASDGIIAPART